MEHQKRDSPNRCAATRPLVDSQCGCTYLHFTVWPINQDLCNSQLWNAFRSPNVEPARSESLTCLGASYLIVCLIHRYSDTISLLTPRWGALVERRPVEIPKEPCLASGRSFVDGAFSGDVFPRGRNSKSWTNPGVRMRASYLFTRIVLIPIWRPEQPMMDTLNY